MLHKAGVERAHLVAHSVGGAAAVVLAHRYPHRVASFINVEGNFTRNAWDVPEFVLRRAASMTIQPAAGHLMMLEDPAAFLKIISRLVDARNHCRDES
jgi:pimeloyl-ACP methyl ester carboxylesterase